MKADKYLDTCTEAECEFVYERFYGQSTHELVEDLLSYIDHEPIKQLVENYRKESK